MRLVPVIRTGSDPPVSGMAEIAILIVRFDNATVIGDHETNGGAMDELLDLQVSARGYAGGARAYACDICCCCCSCCCSGYRPR